jgi:hypothetical protein
VRRARDDPTVQSLARNVESGLLPNGEADPGGSERGRFLLRPFRLAAKYAKRLIAR